MRLAPKLKGCVKSQTRARLSLESNHPLSVIILRHTVAGRVKIDHGHRRIGGIVPHDSHRAIAQLGSRAKVEVDRDLDGGGPGPGSSDNLTLDLVSAAAVNAPSLINKMTRGRYWPHCLLMAHRCVRGVATFWSLTEQQRTMVGTGVECIGRE